MLCEFSWKDKFARRLDVASRLGLFLDVLAETSSFRSNFFEGVVHKGVQDSHSFLGDANLRVNLLQNFVDVDVEGFISFASTWFVAGASCWSSSWHDSSFFCVDKKCVMLLIAPYTIVWTTYMIHESQKTDFEHFSRQIGIFSFELYDKRITL